MGLILLEGLDRTGKSSVAAYYESLGYEKIHLSAPPKDLHQPGYTGPSYLDMMVDVLSQAASRDIVMDRTHYGELIWPQIFGRPSLLNDDDMDVLIELENSVGAKRIMMHDTNVEAHWKRCVDNNEPLNKQQFTKARALYSNLAHKFNFEVIALPDFLKQFPDAKEYVTISNNATTAPAVDAPNATNDMTDTKSPTNKLTPEQQKLEQANAINEILSKKILKGKGPAYNKLEEDIRNFLNEKLGQLLGSDTAKISLSQEEVRFFKTMFRRAMEK